MSREGQEIHASLYVLALISANAIYISSRYAWHSEAEKGEEGPLAILYVSALSKESQQTCERMAKAAEIRGAELE